ncbi:hypothetical protein VE01_08567 [Pseudogymnoascus verrucosus]|uniref:BTB domain-containing protein n=1 Tax=Pseudogymnoascus verrucosus TaxID=342668 RepID=A0A1B8GB83_9PEZI|nr:uncharacterized protein VE01_08567 [Pseudogymnoascus verrucosus]OBT93037.1 hypothetical protein VE01_08567 [Pseudogymnoascus verrucosus]
MFNPAQYPHFQGADVFILAPTGDTWNLHSSMLSSASTKFSELLGINPPAHVTPKQREDGKTIKWRFHMRPDPRGRFVEFEFMAPPAAKQAIFNFNAVDTQIGTDYLHIYDNLFRCMCNIDPILFPGDEALVNDSLRLLQAAEPLKAVPCVRRDIETHLLRTGAYLWKRVLRDVEYWADIGVRLRSPVIFRESMIRIVGLWKVPSAINKQTLVNTANGLTLCDIADKKVQEQTVRKMEIEERLRTFFPRAMLHPPSNDPAAATPGRAFYANDVYYWQALTLVRQYIVKETMAGHGYAAVDGGSKFYTDIGTGGGSYCKAADLEDWHKKFDMTAKGKQRLRDSLNTVKEELRAVVAELMISRSNISRLPNDYPYLTFTEFKDEELPWYTAQTLGVQHRVPAGPATKAEKGNERALFVAQTPSSPVPGAPKGSVPRSSPLSSSPVSKVKNGSELSQGSAKKARLS